jgi:NAD/NADP transhydrogenase beta subunit
MLYGIIGMIALMAAVWIDTTYTYGDGPWLMVASIAPGALLGLWSSWAVGMTSLPEMVGAYNGFGGLAAALTGYGLYLDPDNTDIIRNGKFVAEQSSAMLWVQGIALVLSIVIGMMTFTGSFIASAKLHGNIASKPRIIPYRMFSTLLMVSGMIAFGAVAFKDGWNDRKNGIAYLAVCGVFASIYGVTAVMAIGGGDMPVSICFLNSLSGFSTTATGFMLSNKALVVGGAFVGCSGIILTLVMCNAMNRSVANVLVGGFGEGSSTQKKAAPKADEEQGTVTVMSAEDVVERLTSSKSVIVVPGYGMVSTRRAITKRRS